MSRRNRTVEIAPCNTCDFAAVTLTRRRFIWLTFCGAALSSVSGAATLESVSPTISDRRSLPGRRKPPGLRIVSFESVVVLPRLS